MTYPTLHRQTLFDALRRSAARQPEGMAIQFRDSSWSYREFHALCLRAAGGLQAHGIVPGDRVAILSRNSNAFALARFAVAALGAVLVPVNFMLNAAEAAYILQHSGARLLLVGDTELDKAREAAGQCPDLEALLWLSLDAPAPAGLDAFGELLAAEPLSALPAIDSSAAAQIIYTSGTESAPKGAVLSHGAVLWEYGSMIADAEITGGDKLLHALPLFHCAQLDCFLGPSLQVGGSNVITADNSPANLLRLLQEEAITSFFAPPTVWIALLNDPAFDRTDLSALAKGYYGASIMPVEVLRQIQQRIPQLRLWNLYGQTEIAPVATVLKPEDQLRKPGSAGRPVLHVETRVVDDNGRDVAVGEVGEVVHRSPQLLTEYFRNPEKTAEAFTGGWFHSGDLATVDEEGYLTIVDRKKDMIKTGGENVSGREVEEALYLHPGVAEVAVIGLPHARWVEAVVAVVVAREGVAVDAGALIAHCGERLATFKVPKKIILAQDLPRNPSGKILKRELREAHREAFDE
ncbi:fatty acyl-CoA synthetase [Parahaliea mediterranea]|uniref:Long-chain-fatty-acid--CoA ligase n=1 Tax=Parahaliea mediterranea TaxID=651086 RepID=A0A939DGC4_9GAMM|nr:fatty acyl-CoA synthetase [Parahaliea mediterranea]MBN7797661.1 long-chain-fatty-acid--CoA ligase [Parahaliea mediterranea]